VLRVPILAHVPHRPAVARRLAPPCGAPAP